MKRAQGTTKTRRARRPVVKRRRVARDPFDSLAFAIGAYLESIGWTALVVSEPRVQQQPGDRKCNYEFVVRFTGGQKKPRKENRPDGN